MFLVALGAGLGACAAEEPTEAETLVVEAPVEEITLGEVGAQTTRYCTLQNQTYHAGTCESGWRYPYDLFRYRCSDGGYWDRTILHRGIPCSRNLPQQP